MNIVYEIAKKEIISFLPLKPFNTKIKYDVFDRTKYPRFNHMIINYELKGTNKEVKRFAEIKDKFKKYYNLEFYRNDESKIVEMIQNDLFLYSKKVSKMQSEKILFYKNKFIHFVYKRSYKKKKGIISYVVKL